MIHDPTNILVEPYFRRHIYFCPNRISAGKRLTDTYLAVGQNMSVLKYNQLEYLPAKKIH